MTLKLALATTTEDPRDPRAWSGTPHAILSALERSDDVEVRILGRLDPGLQLIEGLHKVYWTLRSKRFLREREPSMLRRYTTQLEARLGTSPYDMVLCVGSIAAAALPESIPYIVYSDATFALMADYYPNLTGLCSRTMRFGEASDHKAFTRARHVVVTSAWAADSVIGHYGVPAERVSVIPIGAQHMCRRAPAELERRWQARRHGPMRLLWIGVEWERKGGDIAVDVARALKQRGIEVELDMAGLTPTPDVASLPFVNAHGFVDARTKKEKLEDLFLSAFALLLPSRAECSSVVLADAASFGLPSFVSDTGGMRSMVTDGINGAVMPKAASASDYADALAKYWADPARYCDLARSSRRRYEMELTWDIGIRKILDIATAAVAETAACRALEARAG
jgi:glycosyltransferase involved in cell wall biosynthesis